MDLICLINIILYLTNLKNLLTKSHFFCINDKLYVSFIIRRGGVIMIISKNKHIEKTEHFEIVRLKNNEHAYLIILLTHYSPSHLLIEEVKFSPDFDGKILLDRMLHVGNSNDRYVSYDVCEGNIKLDTIQRERFDRKNDIRMLGNSYYRKYPELIKNSILNSSQKKLLLHGLSI